MQVLKLTSRFILSIGMKKTESEKFKKAMEGMPQVKFTEWRQHPFSGFIEFRAEVNIKQAELVRQLTRNLSVYD